MSVLVLLASYNGEKYIAEQIQSILNNSIKPSILIRDDGSTDHTLKILSEFQHQYPEQLTVIKRANNESGHVANFAELCRLALTKKYKYFCFADQDDFWHPNKLNVMQRRMAQLELENSATTPILIHSDLRVVDSNLNETCPSFIEYQGLPDPETHDFPTFLFQNVVTGCASFFNRALLEVATPIPTSTKNHDWWFGLCAKLTGVLDFIDEPLVDYRQHCANSIGATHIQKQKSYLNAYIYKALIDLPRHLSRSIQQAKHLELLAGSLNLDIDKARLLIVEEYANIDSLSLFERTRYSRWITKDSRAPLESLAIKMCLIISKYVR